MVTLQSGAFAMGRTATTWTTKKAGRASRYTSQTTEPPTALSAFGSSSQGGVMLNHQLVWLCASRDAVDVSPTQVGRIWRNILGSSHLPEVERRRGPEHVRKA